MERTIPTEYAPAERVSPDRIEDQSRLFQGPTLASRLLGSVPNILMVVNAQRQIVYANKALYDFLGLREGSSAGFLGARPGEVLRCAHAFESEGGCGTTRFCSTCGAMKAILASQQKQDAVEECRIIQDKTGEALDLRVWARPVQVEGAWFTAFSVVDIRHEKRRQALERLFYHDVLNTAGGVKGSADLLREAEPEEIEVYRSLISDLSDDLIEEIRAQRQLAAAERDELELNPARVITGAFLRRILEHYVHHEAARDRKIHLDEGACDQGVTTDPVLLRRVVVNMVKNALEASGPGELVTLGADSEGSGVEFWVHNPGVIAPNVQLQIFQRSFSTKGPGRGLGTYSIKLLTERYLKGRVSFSSSVEEGTTFRAWCPDMPAKREVADPDADRESTVAFTPLRILVAEDNRVNQLLAVRLLEKQGHSTVAVGDGRAAVEALEKQAFDLVLMDVEMPDMNGLEATRLIRDREKASGTHTPIVALTAHASIEDRARCLAAGMDGCLTKPIQMGELLQAISKEAG